MDIPAIMAPHDIVDVRICINYTTSWKTIGTISTTFKHLGT